MGIDALRELPGFERRGSIGREVQHGEGEGSRFPAVQIDPPVALEHARAQIPRDGVPAAVAEAPAGEGPFVIPGSGGVRVAVVAVVNLNAHHEPERLPLVDDEVEAGLGAFIVVTDEQRLVTRGEFGIVGQVVSEHGGGEAAGERDAARRREPPTRQVHISECPEQCQFGGAPIVDVRADGWNLVEYRDENPHGGIHTPRRPRGIRPPR